MEENVALEKMNRHSHQDGWKKILHHVISMMN